MPRSAPDGEGPLAAEGGPGGAPEVWPEWVERRWWARWLAERCAEGCADVVALGQRDPQKLLERAVQLAFTANAVVQVGSLKPPGVDGDTRAVHADHMPCLSAWSACLRFGTCSAAVQSTLIGCCGIGALAEAQELQAAVVSW